MVDATKMVCPDCGVEMNRHALKIDYNAAPDDGDSADADAGGALIEAHACPVCGQTATRAASGEAA